MNNQSIFKYIKILLYVLMGLGLAVFIYFIVVSAMFKDPAPGYPIGTVGQAMGSGVMLVYAYVLVALAIIVALAFPLINIIKNPKGAMRSLIGLGIMIVILGVSYALSSTEPIVNSAGGYFTNPFELRVADMGLFAAYIMLLGTFLLIIGTEILGAVRKK